MLMYAATLDFCSLENLSCWHVLCFYYHACWRFSPFFSIRDWRRMTAIRKCDKSEHWRHYLPLWEGGLIFLRLHKNIFNPSLLQYAKLPTLGRTASKPRSMRCWKCNSGLRWLQNIGDTVSMIPWWYPLHAAMPWQAHEVANKPCPKAETKTGEVVRNRKNPLPK